MSHTAKRALVTGVAGFIGSHLAERLLGEGFEVVGVDCFTDYYPLSIKQANLDHLMGQERFSFRNLSLARDDLTEVLEGARYVFHQAGQPGVRASWGRTFQAYTTNNVDATQRLLEAVKANGQVEKLVYASSSSVYGRTADLPMTEESRPRPISPYGVTKLAAEHLCLLYNVNFGLPVMCLRYFTVYGPRQRPDMAFNKFVSAMLDDRTITVYGDGEQTRDFTFVSDIVEANWRAAICPHAGEVCNIAGGSRSSVNDVLRLIRGLTGSSSAISHEPRQDGDPEHTFADTSRARRLLDYQPTVQKEEGLAREVQWLRESMSARLTLVG
ncbi:MAG TPA: NAD-dependent epimerase/dehydratase family protein [Chloroflexota bacterium]|nr:NAD-dependent epimerase/dehydratase family protein [Chloroflexota bacterium]